MENPLEGRAPLPEIPLEGRDYHQILMAILEVLRVMDREADQTQALQQSFEGAAGGFGAEKALLLSVESEKPLKLRTIYATGLTTAQIAAVETGESARGISSSLVREAIEERQTRVVMHPSFRRKAEPTKAWDDRDDYSALCAPVLDATRKRVVAVMYFLNSGPNLARAYREADVRFLETYAEALQRVFALYFQKQESGRQIEDLLAGRARPENAPEIIGNSLETAALRRELHETWIPTMESEEPAPVLVRGETGAGKDLVARYLHAYGPRRHKPFVFVNAGEVSNNPDMAKAQFHGHRKGAFTGADRDEPGFFRAAQGGVIFLNEIGELNEQGQVTLLRVLDDWKVTPLGETKEYKVDVFVILATSRDLEKAVEQGRVKRDFLYRFRTQTIRVPPVRERAGDLAALLDHYVRDRERKARKRTLGCTEDALRALLSYSWPGNVREVKEVCTLLVNHVPPGGRIDTALLEKRYPDAIRAPRNPLAGPLLLDDTMSNATRQFQRELIETRVQRHGGNAARAADSLGLPKATFYRWVRRLGVNLDETRTDEPA